MCCLFSSWWAALVTLHVCTPLYKCVRDSSTNITSRCENALWDNQYVWITAWITHTYTHWCIYTLSTRTRSVSLFVGVTFQLLPALPPIKHHQSQPLSGVCLLPPEGTSPSARARPLHRHQQPFTPPSPLVSANRPKQPTNQHGSFWEIHGDDALQAEEMPWWVTLSADRLTAATGAPTCIDKKTLQCMAVCKNVFLLPFRNKKRRSVQHSVQIPQQVTCELVSMIYFVILLIVWRDHQVIPDVFLYSGDCWTLHPWEDSAPVGQNKVPGSLRAHPGSVPLPAQVNDLCLSVRIFLPALFFHHSPTSASVFHSGIRSPWTLPRLCSSWWQRGACPACPPAWGRSIPVTATPTASSTSHTPHRRCLEHLSLLAETEPDTQELNPDQRWWHRTT